MRQQVSSFDNTMPFACIEDFHYRISRHDDIADIESPIRYSLRYFIEEYNTRCLLIAAFL